MAIYSNVITVSEQSWRVVVILSNKMDFKFCAYMVDFRWPSHKWRICGYNFLRHSFTLQVREKKALCSGGGGNTAEVGMLL